MAFAQLTKVICYYTNMLDYEYLESHSSRLGDNPIYRMARDLQSWISQELEKRREVLSTEQGTEVQIYLTVRTFRNWPIFIMGIPEEEGKKVLEAWYFRMLPPEHGSLGLQLVLDRLTLRQLFPERKHQPEPGPRPGPPAPAGPAGQQNRIRSRPDLKPRPQPKPRPNP